MQAYVDANTPSSGCTIQPLLDMLISMEKWGNPSQRMWLVSLILWCFNVLRWVASERERLEPVTGKFASRSRTWGTKSKPNEVREQQGDEPLKSPADMLREELVKMGMSFIARHLCWHQLRSVVTQELEVASTSVSKWCYNEKSTASPTGKRKKTKEMTRTLDLQLAHWALLREFCKLPSSYLVRFHSPPHFWLLTVNLFCCID